MIKLTKIKLSIISKTFKEELERICLQTGGFKQTYFPALWQPKFYLPRQLQQQEYKRVLRHDLNSGSLYSSTIAIAPKCRIILRNPTAIDIARV